MINPYDYAKPNTEHAHQVALFMWQSVAKQSEPRLKWLHAIPNGGLRDKRVAGRLKAEGVKEGISDVFLPCPLGDERGKFYSGLYIEMKRIKSSERESGIARAKGIESSKQEQFRTDMIEAGYCAVVAYGWLEARKELCKYLYEDWPFIMSCLDANVDDAYKIIK